MKQAKVLSDKELKKVIDYIEAFDRHSERNRAIILLTHYCGMRVSEVASLFVSDIVNDKGEINEVIHLTANQTKGTESRGVFVSKKAKQALKRYLQSDLSVIQQSYLFQTQKSKRFNTTALITLIKHLYERVGIVGASSHSGRRTFITKLATSGISVRVIAEAVGHSSIATTQRYIDVNDGLISNAVERI
ncbi:site-specific integrase [Alphaproteobacteria bacterium]|nr:site-specific integrase [Alphaproteobacteria bacterium]